MKKRLITLMLAGAMAFSLAACGSKGTEDTAADAASDTQTDESNDASEPETVTITSLNGSGEETSLEVPYKPERVAILDMAALDIIDSIGEGDSVVGRATTSIEYLQD